MRTHETEVEVFGGEVESLTTAGIEGVGVRVIVDHRQGYAWAGSLDPDVVDETLREARDNAAFGEPDEWYGARVAGRRRRCRRRRSRLVARRAARACRPRRRCASRSTSKRRRRPPTRGSATSKSAGYGDALAESALANSLGVEAHDPTHDVLRVVGRARRRRLGHPDRVRLRRPGVRSPISTSSRSRATRSTAPCRLLGAEADRRPAHRRDPRSAGHPFGARRAVERVQR